MFKTNHRKHSRQPLPSGVTGVPKEMSHEGDIEVSNTPRFEARRFRDEDTSGRPTA